MRQYLSRGIRYEQEKTGAFVRGDMLESRNWKHLETLGLKTRTRNGLYARDTWLDSALLVHDEPERARGELQTKCLGI